MTEKLPEVPNTFPPSEIKSSQIPEVVVPSRGKLKVFLGYAPGTGKTLAMLEDAYRRMQEGVDVAVGDVDIQGESLANQLIETFEVIPQRLIDLSEKRYPCLDLDAVLARRPALVLMDSLARANPPGLRHQARFLEVEELLRAGIDVYTTVNVYQIESQVDAVSFITRLTSQETVPDRLLDGAEQIEMVDLPPQELMDRFQKGKLVFKPEQKVLMEKIFQPSSLFALRELTMRYVARRSNDLLRTYLADRGLVDTEPASQHFLVCIAPLSSGESLVRAGRRMADETRSEWSVIYVETPEHLELSREEQSQLTQTLRLAEMLGAKTEILTGRSVHEAVREYAFKHHIHKVVVGRSRPPQGIGWFQRSLAERLLSIEPSMNVYVVGEEAIPLRFQIPRFMKLVTPFEIPISLVLATVPTVLGVLLSPYIISRSANLVMLYLCSVMIASIFLGVFPAILTAVLCVLFFKYWFVPPLYQFWGFAPEYTITFISLLMIGIILSTLVSRERTLSRAAHRRAEQITRLYEFSRDLANAVDMPDILKTVVQHISQTFDREAVVLMPENGKLVLSACSSNQTLDRSELTAAEWAFQQGLPAGALTGTFSYASNRYLPMQTTRGTVGVIGICFQGDLEDMHPEQTRLLGTFVTKAATSIERGLFAEEASQAEVLRAAETLQTALLNSISHDLRTPLASITGVLSSLRLEDDFIDQETRRDLVETALGEAERLNRLVGNLLDMTRLEAGTLHITLQPCDIQDVIGSTLNTLTARLEDHPVNVQIQPELPLVPMDYVLINQVIINLVENAVKYSPVDGPIGIVARIIRNHLQVEVADRGPGIPEEDLERIFEKFYRVKRFKHVVGTGLGLSICKGIIEAHQGKIWAENRQGGGASLIFELRLENNHE